MNWAIRNMVAHWATSTSLDSPKLQVRGFHVSQVNELRSALQAWQAAPGCALIDVQADAEEMVQKPKNSWSDYLSEAAYRLARKRSSAELRMVHRRRWGRSGCRVRKSRTT